MASTLARGLLAVSFLAALYGARGDDSSDCSVQLTGGDVHDDAAAAAAVEFCSELPLLLVYYKGKCIPERRDAVLAIEIIDASSSSDARSLAPAALSYQLARDAGRWAPRTRYVEAFFVPAGAEARRRHYGGLWEVMEMVRRGPGRLDLQVPPRPAPPWGPPPLLSARPAGPLARDWPEHKLENNSGSTSGAGAGGRGAGRGGGGGRPPPGYYVRDVEALGAGGVGVLADLPSFVDLLLMKARPAPRSRPPADLRRPLAQELQRDADGVRKAPAPPAPPRPAPGRGRAGVARADRDAPQNMFFYKDRGGKLHAGPLWRAPPRPAPNAAPGRIDGPRARAGTAASRSTGARRKESWFCDMFDPEGFAFLATTLDCRPRPSGRPAPPRPAPPAARAHGGRRSSRTPHSPPSPPPAGPRPRPSRPACRLATRGRRELRAGPLAPERLEATVGRLAAEIAPPSRGTSSGGRTTSPWTPPAGPVPAPRPRRRDAGPRAGPAGAGNVERVRAWLRHRGAWLDANIGSLHASWRAAWAAKYGL
eukprot:tig00000949_g5733.t1